MKIWDLVSLQESEELKTAGLLRRRFADLELHDQPEHLWLFRQACERLGLPPVGGLAPLWGWSQWRGEARKRPDMRSYMQGNWEAPIVRLELEIPDHLLVEFDFDLFTNFVPFNLYLPTSPEDEKRFEESAKRFGLDYQTARENRYFAGEIQRSWERTYDLSLSSVLWPDSSEEEHELSIATLCWEYRSEWVQRIEPFDFTRSEKK